MAEAGLAARAASIVSTSLWWPGIFRRSGRPPGEHVRAAGAAFIFMVPPVPGERYAAGSWPLRASSRAAILAVAAACELVSGGSVAASAAAHAL